MLLTVKHQCIYVADNLGESGYSFTSKFAQVSAIKYLGRFKSGKAASCSAQKPSKSIKKTACSHGKGQILLRHGHL